MELAVTNRPDFLAGGEPARLIPITADSAREQKSVSVLLAGLRSVSLVMGIYQNSVPTIAQKRRC